MTATRRLIGGFALLVALGWAAQANAQLGAGTTWLRTDANGKGIVLTLEACCKGGLRFIWQLPAMGGQPSSTMAVDSPMNGSSAPVLVGGKPSGETMAITRLDDHHYRATMTMNGKPYGTANGTVSADNKSMTVESVVGTGGEKTIETWARK